MRAAAVATWTEIEEVMPLGQLRAGYDRLHRALEGQPSRYADRPGDGTLETPADGALAIPALLDRRVKTGSKTGRQGCDRRRVSRNNSARTQVRAHVLRSRPNDLRKRQMLRNLAAGTVLPGSLGSPTWASA